MIFKSKDFERAISGIEDYSIIIRKYCAHLANAKFEAWIRRTPKPYETFMIAKIEDLRARGLTGKQIAKMLVISRPQVYRLAPVKSFIPLKRKKKQK